MSGYFLVNLIALVLSQVNGYPYGNQSPKFIWDTYRCSNINPIVDSKTIILIGGGRWPADQFCHAIRRDLKVSDDTAYTMTADFISLSGNANLGHVGLTFNYWDDNNYDWVYKRVHSTTTVFGSIKNGVLAIAGTITNDPPIQSRKWYNLKIEVSTNKNVNVFLNGVRLNKFVKPSFKAFFTTRGYGGVIVANGYKNVVQFRNFDVAPILGSIGGFVTAPPPG